MTVRLSLSLTARTRKFVLLMSLAVLSFFSLTYFLKSNVSVAGGREGNEQAEQIGPDDRDANKPHWLVGSYYSTQNGLTATLLLNNKGAQALEVRPTIYNLSGQSIEIPPVSVEASSFRFVNLQEWAAMGDESFSQGSIRLFHVGKDLVLGAQIYLLDEANSLSYEEKLAEVENFDSRRYEGVWWMPSREAEVQIVLSNITDASLSVTAWLLKRPHYAAEARVVELAAHETRVLDLRQDFADGEHFANSEILALSLENTGAKSALLARAMIKEARNGYSNVVQFSNPSGGKSREYQGVGFHIDDVEGERLVPVIVARNVGSEAATVRARLPYTRSDSTIGVIELPQVKLQAGEMSLLDTHKVTQRSRREQIQIAGLEVEYDTAPGSVIVNAHSVSQSGNQVFRVPMWDPQGQRSPTGGYPWRIEGTSTTKTYIKNITDRVQYYVASLRWPNDEGYMIGMKSIAPHQTVEIDVKSLRDEQVPDVSGRLIPLDVASGQLTWSQKQVGPPPSGDEARQKLALIGRSEQVDVKRGMSSNYACQSCCSNGYHSSFVTPSSSDVTAGAQVDFDVFQRDKDCYGVVGLPYPQTLASWSSDVPAVATVNGSGTADTEGAGQTTIRSSWTDYRYDLQFVPCFNFSPGAPQCYNCDAPTEVFPNPSATLQVRPIVTINEVGFTGDYQITRWADSAVIDNPDGSAPTWKSASNPNHPVAYAKSATVTMFAKLGINPSAPSTSAKIRVKNSSTVIATKDISVSGTTTTVTGISTSSALETAIKTTTPTFTWEISFNGGSNWSSIGNSGPHTMHWTHGAPMSPSFQDDNGFTYSALYDLALEKACGYANGDSDLSTVIDNVNKGVKNQTFYNPELSIGTLHPLFAYEPSGAAGIQCSDEAYLLRGLLRSIGIDGTVLFIWAGPNASTLTRYTIGTTGLSVSFRLLRDAHDAALLNPHFNFHAVVSTNNTWYDPSYGMTYSSLSFNETANNNTPQQIHSSRWTSTSLSSFVCSHIAAGGEQP